MIARWKINERAHPIVLRSFAECVLDLHEAAIIFERKGEIEEDKTGEGLRRAVRKTAVVMRKICLDSGGRLIKQCVKSPMFPRLQEVGSSPSLHVDAIRPGLKGTATRKDGNSKDFEFPEAAHQVSLQPLPGVEFGEQGACILHTPFDRERPPIKFQKWLRQKVLQIDSVVYHAEALLRLVANYEGAHVQALRTMAPSGLSLDQVDTRTDMQYRLANFIRFGMFTYPQLFTLYSGLAVMFLAKEMTEEILSNEGVTGTSETTKPARPTVRWMAAEPVLESRVVYAADPLYIFGEDGNPHPREGTATKTKISTPRGSQDP